MTIVLYQYYISRWKNGFLGTSQCTDCSKNRAVIKDFNLVKEPVNLSACAAWSFSDTLAAGKRVSNLSTLSSRLQIIKMFASLSFFF